MCLETLGVALLNFQSTSSIHSAVPPWHPHRPKRAKDGVWAYFSAQACREGHYPVLKSPKKLRKKWVRCKIYKHENLVYKYLQFMFHHLHSRIWWFKYRDVCASGYTMVSHEVHCSRSKAVRDVSRHWLDFMAPSRGPGTQIVFKMKKRKLTFWIWKGSWNQQHPLLFSFCSIFAFNFVRFRDCSSKKFRNFRVIFSWFASWYCWWKKSQTTTGWMYKTLWILGYQEIYLYYINWWTPDFWTINSINTQLLLLLLWLLRAVPPLQKLENTRHPGNFWRRLKRWDELLFFSGGPQKKDVMDFYPKKESDDSLWGWNAQSNVSWV